MSRLVSFSVFTPLRHPAYQKGYNSKTHSYRKEYVNPRFWVLHLYVIPPWGESSDGKPIVPPEIASFVWTIRQVDGDFRHSVEKKRSTSMFRSSANVPSPGIYEVTLTVNRTDGTAEVQTRRFRLRDFLVIGIGDSFASGQGNPDVPAVPTLEQKGFCRLTSVALAASRAQKFIEDFIGAELELAADAIGHLPFAGKIVVAGANGVADVVGFIRRGASDLKDWALKVISTAEEAIEEGLSWFGIGDGAEESPHPAAWQEPLAYRSYWSGQSLAAKALEAPMGGDRITFLSFGRTGSTINNGLLGPRTIDELLGGSVSIDQWTGNRGQIAEARETAGGRPIDAVMISIGVNDLGFSSLVTKAILKASGQKRKDRINGAKGYLREKFPDDLRALKDAIDTQLSPKHVFITEYPVNVFKEIADGAKPCGVLSSTVPSPGSMEGFDLDDSDAGGFGEVGQLLNESIRDKAREFGWILVDGIEDAFDRHGYCPNKGFHSYFVSAEESCLDQGDFEGMLHPNRRGHEVTRDCIARTLRPKLFSEPMKWLEPVLQLMMRPKKSPPFWLEPILGMMMK